MALGNYASADHAASSRFVAAITSPDVIAIVGFCAIGLLVTAGLIGSFPNLVRTALTFRARNAFGASTLRHEQCDSQSRRIVAGVRVAA